MNSFPKLNLLRLMAKQHPLRSLHSLHDFTVETPFPCSPSLKLKSLLKVQIPGHVRHVVRSLTNAKSMAMELLNQKRKKKKGLLSFFKHHLNWSSSYVIPMPELPNSKSFDVNHAYYDPTRSSAMLFTEESVTETELPSVARCLHWLEKNSEASEGDDEEGTEIDQLAEEFIASCHEKFRLEKQESYRRYQEMLARSV